MVLYIIEKEMHWTIHFYILQEAINFLQKNTKKFRDGLLYSTPQKGKMPLPSLSPGLT